MTCVYIGCSTHSVPSWSKVAMRASGGTKFGLDWSVVARTNARIASFAAPSFHDGSGSAVWACANVRGSAPARTGSAARVESTTRRSMPRDVADVICRQPFSLRTGGVRPHDGRTRHAVPTVRACS